MIDSFIILISNAYGYIRKHPEIITSILLVLVVPVAFIASGEQFLRAGQENQDRLERERINILHDMFEEYLIEPARTREEVQHIIERLNESYPDIVELTIAMEQGTVVRTFAALNTDADTEVENQDRLLMSAAVPPHTSIMLPGIERGVRYLDSYRRIQPTTEVTYFLYTRSSLERIDSLFASAVARAYYWLFGILALVLLLLLRHVRLIDYARLYRETRRANEMKDLFTNMVAHELRAPLTAIRGYASMIRERETVAPDIKDIAIKIEKSTERLIRIINDLLDVARIHSGKLGIEKRPVHVGAVITTVIETMGGYAEEKHITLQYDGAQGEVVVTADETRLYQALTNLVSNALKYTKSGTISVTLEDRANRVEIRVKDTGMGIDAESQKHLFAPFFRVEHTDVNEQTVGTGLGMWITKQLIELMGGSIGVESIKGVGTHVVITLPKG